MKKCFCDLEVGDVLLSSNADFVLVGRRGETFVWLDLQDKVFEANMSPSSPVPQDYTILRGAHVIRRPIP